VKFCKILKKIFLFSFVGACICWGSNWCKRERT